MHVTWPLGGEDVRFQELNTKLGTDFGADYGLVSRSPCTADVALLNSWYGTSLTCSGDRYHVTGCDADVTAQLNSPVCQPSPSTPPPAPPPPSPPPPSTSPSPPPPSLPGCGGGTWTHTVGQHVYGHNTKQLTDVTIEDCKIACCDAQVQYGFVCLSFDWFVNEGSRCDLSDEGPSTVALTANSGAYDNYALVPLPPP